MQKTITKVHIFTVLLCSLTLIGCGGNDGRPDDMPKLYSVTITVTQSGEPLEGSLVTLVNKTPATYSTASGTTNASGSVRPRTYGYDGVPAGEYSVVIEKRVIEGQRESRTPEGETTMVGGQLFQYVEAQYTQADSSPHTLTVTERGATETFDVGEPVRVFMSAIPE